jgi:hypothetical protein
MPLTKRTTVLFTPELYERLTREAERRRTSVGHLIREACESSYRVDSIASRLAAAERLTELDLPVGTPSEMEAESVPRPEELMP